MNRLKLFFLIVIGILVPITFDITATKRSVIKAAKALQEHAKNYNQFTDIDQVLDSMGKIRSKFHKLTYAEWVEALYLPKNGSLISHSSMDIINIKIHLLLCNDCKVYRDRSDIGIPCSTIHCAICRFIRMQFQMLERDYKRFG